VAVGITGGTVSASAALAFNAQTGTAMLLLRLTQYQPMQLLHFQ